MTVIDIKGQLGQRGEFHAAVRHTLAAQCFEPDQIERFLGRAESDAIEKLWSLDVREGCRAYAGAARAGAKSLSLEFIIPSSWRRRYFIIEQAVRALQAQPGMGFIDLTIDEAPPSHTAYFAALLPTLGFEMDARVSLWVGQEILQRVRPPPLAAGFAEIDFTPGRLSDFAECLARGFAPFDDDWPPSRVRRDQAFWAEELAAADETAAPRPQSWVGIEHEARVVGCCEGGWRKDELFIRNIAVVPPHWRRGLGTWLLIRCMQKLRDRSADRRSPFTLNVQRGWQPAMAFYRRLGFQVSRIFTRALWRREGPG